MSTSQEREEFLAYAAEQVATANEALARHTAGAAGLCACGRRWPCPEVLWWTWLRSHYSPLLPPAASQPNLVRPYVSSPSPVKPHHREPS